MASYIKRGPDPCLPLIRKSNYLNPTLVSTALSTQPSFTVISALAVNAIWIKKKTSGQSRRACTTAVLDWTKKRDQVTSLVKTTPEAVFEVYCTAILTSVKRTE